MKRTSLPRLALLALAFALAPSCLMARGAPKADLELKGFALPDGTVTDLNLFKNREKFNEDREARIGGDSPYSDYTKHLRRLTKEESAAWKESKQPVETEDYFLKRYSSDETDLLDMMKKKKAVIGSSFTFEDDRMRVIYVTADKKYTALSYEKFYLVERAEDELGGNVIKGATLPDGTVSDLVTFINNEEYKQYYDYSLGSSQSTATATVGLVMAFATGGLVTMPGSGKWEMAYTLTPKEAGKAASGENISRPGYMIRTYTLKQMKELGRLMDEKEFAGVAVVRDIGGNKRQLISVAQKNNWQEFELRKIDYVWKESN
ncbi:MAG: hypothetical protein II837_00350 [Treponema sp.]|nr:hypothetical protein [Treponema sp.]